MNFRPHERDEPELNLIPLIDVLIILLIFLVMTTTFAQQRSLDIHLPEAGALPSPKPTDQPVTLGIDQAGHYRVGNIEVDGSSAMSLKIALQQEAKSQVDPVIEIEADRNSTHQALVIALDALAQLGYKRISFAAVPPAGH
jgi:biopolymer transport protein ExbD